MAAIRLSAPENYASLFSAYDTWLFDCDGVLWIGDQLIDGVAEVLQMLRRNQKKVLFVTNNSTKSRKEIRKKFVRFGVEVHLDEIYGGAYVAAVYLSSVLRLPSTQKVYVIGMKGLEEELAAEGVSFIGGTDPADCSINGLPTLIPQTFNPDPSVSAVLCGLDFSFTYTKLAKGSRYLLSSPNCHFVAVNTYPTAQGSALPGAGAIVEALRVATGRAPVCAGKPSPLMLECVRAKVPFDPKRTIMVGDRLDADIPFGKQGGLGTLLVLTGVSTESDLNGPNPSPVVPDYVTNSLGDLQSLVISLKVFND